MRKLLMIAFIPILLAACASEGKYSEFNTLTQLDDCGDGGTWVNVRYGDSYLEVKPKVHLKKGSIWEFRLDPRTKKSDTVDYEEMAVTIKGKASDPDASWIDVKGTFEKDRGILSLCVNPAQAENIKTYEYEVHVEKIGMLDPRAEVEK